MLELRQLQIEAATLLATALGYRVIEDQHCPSGYRAEHRARHDGCEYLSVLPLDHFMDIQPDPYRLQLLISA